MLYNCHYLVEETRHFVETLLHRLHKDTEMGPQQLHRRRHSLAVVSVGTATYVKLFLLILHTNGCLATETHNNLHFGLTKLKRGNAIVLTCTHTCVHAYITHIETYAGK